MRVSDELQLSGAHRLACAVEQSLDEDERRAVPRENLPSRIHFQSRNEEETGGFGRRASRVRNSQGPAKHATLAYRVWSVVRLTHRSTKRLAGLWAERRRSPQPLLGKA